MGLIFVKLNLSSLRRSKNTQKHKKFIPLCHSQVRYGKGPVLKTDQNLLNSLE